jgi:tRNA(Ile)-lysidine synthase
MSPRAAGEPLSRRFRQHVRDAGLLHPGERVLVALSGGLDSTVLLHLIRFHLPQVQLTAAHVDHAMRPDSSADADWVRGLCTAWSVTLHSERLAAVPPSEAAARDARYAFLFTAATRCDARAIVTAHHADDQAETVLFRLARGTGVAGLAGIPQRRGTIVRPLLPFGRAELLAYARAAHLRWRDDPTNAELRFERNRIRHIVLPALEAARPGAARRIAQVAARVAEAEAAWHDVVSAVAQQVIIRREASAYALARERLLDYHPHIRARVVRHLLGDLGSRPDRAGTRVAMEFINSGVSGARITLAGGVVVEREFDLLLLRRPRHDRTGDDVQLHIDAAVAGSGSFTTGGAAYRARWSPGPGDAGAGQTASFDPSSLRFPLELRAWRAGDRIRLAYGSKKLKKLFRERRVGRAQRGRTAVLSDAAGNVLWVVGEARSTVALPAPGGAVFQITVMDSDTE